MLFYFLKCKKMKKNTENTNPVVSKSSNGKRMILLECVICGAKKSNAKKS